MARDIKPPMSTRNEKIPSSVLWTHNSFSQKRVCAPVHRENVGVRLARFEKKNYAPARICTGLQ
jgi:hypothetical protein